jgi:hypothetical protein
MFPEVHAVILTSAFGTLKRRLCPFSSFSSSIERSASSNGWTLVEGFVKRYLVGAFIFADVLSVDSTPRSLFLLPQKA